MDLQTFRPPNTEHFTPPLLEGLDPKPEFELVPLRQSWRQKMDELRYDSRRAANVALEAKLEVERTGQETDEVRRRSLDGWGEVITTGAQLQEVKRGLLRAHLVGVRGIDNGDKPATVPEVLDWLDGEGEHVGVQLVAHLLNEGRVSSLGKDD